MSKRQTNPTRKTKEPNPLRTVTYHYMLFIYFRKTTKMSMSRMLEKTEGQTRNTGNIGHKTQNGDKQQKYDTENINGEQHGFHQKYRVNTRAREW